MTPETMTMAGGLSGGREPGLCIYIYMYVCKYQYKCTYVYIYTYVSNVLLLCACRDVPWLMACLGVQDCEVINWADLCGRSLPAGKCFHVQCLG